MKLDEFELESSGDEQYEKAIWYEFRKQHVSPEKKGFSFQTDMELNQTNDDNGPATRRQAELLERQKHFLAGNRKNLTSFVKNMQMLKI